jgi:hypothetical protein
MLMPLDLDPGDRHGCPSSRVGESILRSFSVPRNLWAFDRLLLVLIAGELAGGTLFLLDVCFRPGMGKRNLEVLPMLAAVSPSKRREL